ncbi:MAG: zf-HC2 domain-containing protein [Desulfobacterales bacterium]|nr:zf-HC2 domain-containing protein [Desulfobacterales bacterium]
MKCRDAQKKLNAYIDKETGGSETAGIRSHLETCSRCGRDAQALTRLSSALNTMVPPSPRSRLRRNTLARFKAESSRDRHRTWKSPLAWMPTPMALGGGAAGLALGALLGVSLTTSSSFNIDLAEVIFSAGDLLALWV